MRSQASTAVVGGGAVDWAIAGTAQPSGNNAKSSLAAIRTMSGSPCGSEDVYTTIRPSRPLGYMKLCSRLRANVMPEVADAIRWLPLHFDMSRGTFLSKRK